MDADGNWTMDASRIAAFTGEVAEAHLARAMKQEGIVTDPYFMEVTETGAVAGRETLRETIRVSGPTVAYGEGA
jgi:hypothetical protein